MPVRYTWTEVDFRPAPLGWRLVYLIDDQVQIVPMPGWLIEEQHEDRAPFTRTGSRRVVAADMDEYAVDSVAGRSAFWMVLGPEQDEPTPDDITAEITRRWANGSRG